MLPRKSGIWLRIAVLALASAAQAETGEQATGLREFSKALEDLSSRHGP